MSNIKHFKTPLCCEEIDSLEIGDLVTISGVILAGRDAVLPKICDLISNGALGDMTHYLEGSVMFHTAVSPAGVGPTSSNKVEIESSFGPLSASGVRMHLGKGRISSETVDILKRTRSCFAVIPPVTALLGERTISSEVLAFPELGMESLHLLRIEKYPAIIAAVKGRSIFDEFTNGCRSNH